MRAPLLLLCAFAVSCGGPPRRRQRTLANSQKMANDAKSWVHAAGVSVKTVVDDRTTSTLPDSAFDAPILFKRSALPHDGTAQYYFGKLLAHAGLD